MEAILPIEMGVHSLRTVLESEIPNADLLQSKYDQLCMLDEKRLKALYHRSEKSSFSTRHSLLILELPQESVSLVESGPP